MLKLENLSKTYQIGTFGGKQLHAVTDVSFDMPDGEVVSLIGESGSGKSTIGKMILRLISGTSGRILFDDIDVTKLKKSEMKEYYRKVQGVFQDPFSSYNPIYKADRIFSVARDEFFPEVSEADWRDRLTDSLEAVGLNPEHVLNKYPHQLSGGQLQRFMIARALLLNVEFLVADEIISMLDASTRIDVLNLFADFKKRGLSILFITHDLSLGNYISERAVILYRGCVVEMGVTHQIFTTPLHPYTRMLMASVPRLDQKWAETEDAIEKTSTKFGREKGCVYYERCGQAGKDEGCRHERPPLVEVEPGHFVACCKQ